MHKIYGKNIRGEKLDKRLSEKRQQKAMKNCSNCII